MSGIIVCLTLAATLAGPPVETTAPASRPAAGAEISRLIEQLGDADFKLRTAAIERLKAIGMPAYDQLKAASENSSDAEVASNCENLLALIEPLATAERLARAHPHLARALRAAAVSKPSLVLDLAGTAGQQMAAMGYLGSLSPMGDALAIFHEWATRADNEEVRYLAANYYVNMGLSKDDGLAFLQKNAVERRRLIAVVFSDRWRPPRRAYRSTQTRSAVFKLKGSIPPFIQMLARLRHKAEMTNDQLDVLALWIATAIRVPASAKSQLVLALMPFLDDTRTLLISERIVTAERRDYRFQIADIALLALSRLTGGKWTTTASLKGLRAGENAGYLFKSDAVRRKHIAAFRTWYKKNRDQFGPDPATRPATRPAAQQ